MGKAVMLAGDGAVRLALCLGMAMALFQAPAFAQTEGARPQELPALGVRSGLTDGDFVFVGTVESAVAHAAGWSHPPRWQFTIRFGDLDMIEGERPDQMVLGFTTHDDGAEVLKQGARVVVEAKNGRVETIKLATDEAVLAAGGEPGSGDSIGAKDTKRDLAALLFSEAVDVAVSGENEDGSVTLVLSSADEDVLRHIQHAVERMLTQREQRGAKREGEEREAFMEPKPERRGRDDADREELQKERNLQL